MDEPTTTADTATDQGSRRLRFTELGSALALLISVLALGLGVYQTRVMQAQARASVWPYLAVGYSYYDGGEHPGFSWEIANHGVGPAKIESVVVRVDGQPMHDWDEVLNAVLDKPRAQIDTVMFHDVNRVVLPPDGNRDTTLAAIWLGKPDDARRFADSVHRLDMEVCYCSVYDDCWVARWERPPVSVARCDQHEDIRFRN